MDNECKWKCGRGRTKSGTGGEENYSGSESSNYVPFSAASVGPLGATTESKIQAQTLKTSTQEKGRVLQTLKKLQSSVNSRKVYCSSGHLVASRN